MDGDGALFDDMPTRDLSKNKRELTTGEADGCKRTDDGECIALTKISYSKLATPNASGCGGFDV